MFTLISSVLVASFFIGLLILCVIAKVFSWPLAMLWKCIYNSIVGAIVLYVINFIGLVYIPINFLSAFIAGVFGIPGVLLLVIWALL